MHPNNIKHRIRQLLDARGIAGLPRATEIRFTPSDKEELELAETEVLGNILATAVKKKGVSAIPAFMGLKITGWDAEKTTIS